MTLSNGGGLKWPASMEQKMLPATLPSTMADLRTLLASFITDVNSLWVSAVASSWPVSNTDVALVAPATSFVANDVPFEIIWLTADAAVNLQEITGGRKGAIKILVADDANVTLIHNAAKLKLNGGLDVPLAQNDILFLANRDGDPETATDGYWQELLRTPYVA